MGNKTIGKIAENVSARERARLVKNLRFILDVVLRPGTEYADGYQRAILDIEGNEWPNEETSWSKENKNA